VWLAALQPLRDDFRVEFQDDFGPVALRLDDLLGSQAWIPSPGALELSLLLEQARRPVRDVGYSSRADSAAEVRWTPGSPPRGSLVRA
jgi:hypothetical protein